MSGCSRGLQILENWATPANICCFSFMSQILFIFSICSLHVTILACKYQNQQPRGIQGDTPLMATELRKLLFYLSIRSVVYICLVVCKWLCDRLSVVHHWKIRRNLKPRQPSTRCWSGLVLSRGKT